MTSAAASCPIQGTAETPALQAPLTILDDDNAPVPTTISLAPPRELVECILLLLDTKSMLTCRLVNREFNDIIQSSTLLQYRLACTAAGVIDNPRSPLSYAERLEALLEREDAWRKLKPVFETTIKVNHQPWSIYELTGGRFFLSNNNRKDLHYCHLPSSPQDNPQWIRIPAHGPEQTWSGHMGDITMAVYEHDLIVNVIFSEVGDQAQTQRHSLDLVLIKLSTGAYHPLARHPKIHLQRSYSVRPIVLPTVVGDNLALVVYSRDGTFPDRLIIFDWKTGHKRLQHEASRNAYAAPVFLSPELLLVPNLILSHFEVWHLSPSQLNKPPVRIISLQLPTISPYYSLVDVNCRGEPNPCLHSMPYLPPRPFFSSPENSVIMANLYLRSGLQNTFYTLIMHRRPSTTSSTSRYDFLQVQWADWGPSISRWFRVNETHAWWITECTGQRCAFSDRNPRDSRKLMVSVADFNPHRNAEMMVRLRRGEGEVNDCIGNKEEGEGKEELEILDHGGIFSEEVYMGLKCVIYRAPDEYDFDVVLMDEERLLGLKVSN
ncbi:hypothetical protein M378DRAFT_86867 [Amanita muscaria Koide BX008]|uniref:F-box domain-containing protein n=1 Tax=Amanita muscaria (strain Koide BX008) TaxID=946122 RepID=A0A0C2WAA5_AMAMK|nr:hypothetical protein M378DRAFT_86867 [Amanita muscaria Koide BX008]